MENGYSVPACECLLLEVILSALSKQHLTLTCLAVLIRKQALSESELMLMLTGHIICSC
jgi:hypothetical protein